jgi:hypothetical protein
MDADGSLGELALIGVYLRLRFSPPIHADGRGLEVSHNPPDFRLGLAKINQQTYGKTSGFKIIQALGHMHFIQGFGCLEFYDDLFFN